MYQDLYLDRSLTIKLIYYFRLDSVDKVKEYMEVILMKTFISKTPNFIIQTTFAKHQSFQKFIFLVKMPPNQKTCWWSLRG